MLSLSCCRSRSRSSGGGDGYAEKLIGQKEKEVEITGRKKKLLQITGGRVSAAPLSIVVFNSFAVL